LKETDSRCSDHRPIVADLAKLPPIEPVTAETFDDVVRAAGGRAVLVNFWATWCQPCVEEMPGLLEAARSLEDEGLRLVLVTCDFEDQKGAAAALLARLGVGFTTYIKVGKDDPFIRAVEPEWSGALPATLVYDGAGRKHAFHAGPATADEFVALARQVLDAAPRGKE
jgi:thiol-disulfide isomerase/thioredoxin